MAKIKTRIAAFRLAIDVWIESGASGLEEINFKRRVLLTALKAMQDEGNPAADSLQVYLTETRKVAGGRPRNTSLKARKPYRGHKTASLVDVRVDELAACGESVAVTRHRAGQTVTFARDAIVLTKLPKTRQG